MSTPWMTAVAPKAFLTSRIATEAIHSSRAARAALRVFFFVFSTVRRSGTSVQTKSSRFRPSKSKPDVRSGPTAVGRWRP